MLAKTKATYELLEGVGSVGVATAAGPPTRLGGGPDHSSDDPVVRRRLDEAFRAVRRGEADEADLLAATALRLSGGRPVGATVLLPDGSGHEWQLVTTLRDEDPWSNALRTDFEAVLGEPGQDFGLAAASLAHLDTVTKSVEVLRDADPRLLGVLRHTSTVAVVSGPDAFESASDRLLPRCVYVNETALACDPVRAAEALLHESVHQKLYDLQLVHGIYRSDYDERTAPGISPAWHQGKARWSFDRALAACHVYAHLAYFYQRLSEAAPSFRDAASHAQGARSAHSRAAALAAALVPHGADQLNRSGRGFLGWVVQEINRQATDTIGRSTP